GRRGDPPAPVRGAGAQAPGALARLTDLPLSYLPALETLSNAGFPGPFPYRSVPRPRLWYTRRPDSPQSGAGTGCLRKLQERVRPIGAVDARSLLRRRERREPETRRIQMTKRKSTRVPMAERKSPSAALPPLRLEWRSPAELADNPRN